MKAGTHLHDFLVPILRKMLHLSIFHLKDSRSTPLSLSPIRRDIHVGLPTERPLGRVPQQDVTVFGEDAIEAEDAQVVDALHNVSV